MKSKVIFFCVLIFFSEFAASKPYTAELQQYSEAYKTRPSFGSVQGYAPKSPQRLNKYSYDEGVTPLRYHEQQLPRINREDTNVKNQQHLMPNAAPHEISNQRYQHHNRYVNTLPQPSAQNVWHNMNHQLGQNRPLQKFPDIPFVQKLQHNRLAIPMKNVGDSNLENSRLMNNILNNNRQSQQRSGEYVHQARNQPRETKEVNTVPMLHTVEDSFMPQIPPVPVQSIYHSNENDIIPLNHFVQLEHPSQIREVQTPHQIEQANTEYEIPIEERYAARAADPVDTISLSRPKTKVEEIFRSHPKIKELLTSTKLQKKYLVVHPDGTVEHVDNLDTVVKKHPNYIMVNAGDIVPKLGTNSAKPKDSLSQEPKPAQPLPGVEFPREPVNPNPINTPHIVQEPSLTTLANIEPAIPNIPPSVIPSFEKSKPVIQGPANLNLSPSSEMLPIKTLPTGDLKGIIPTVDSTLLPDDPNKNPPIVPTPAPSDSKPEIIVAPNTAQTPLPEDQVQDKNITTSPPAQADSPEKNSQAPTISQNVPITMSPTQNHSENKKIEAVLNDSVTGPTNQVPIQINSLTVPPHDDKIINTTETSPTGEVTTLNNTSISPELTQTAVVDGNSTSTTQASLLEVNGKYNEVPTKQSIPEEIKNGSISQNPSSESPASNGPDGSMSGIESPGNTLASEKEQDEINDVTTAAPVLSNLTTVGPISTTSASVPDLGDLDISRVKSSKKPTIWFRTTDLDFWDKITDDNKDFDVLYFFSIHNQPRVENDRKQTIFPNGTIIEEITHTVYDPDCDEPKVTKTSKVIHPAELLQV